MTTVEPPIKAIPTRYAGCHFRSRLEARWAVFFDTLGLTWEYEAQGYECDWRLNLDDGKFPYLPDFWLPSLGMHAEVKGSLTAPECVRLLNAAASLSAPRGGCGEGPDTVVLGPLPKDGEHRSPIALHMHKGDLTARSWLTTPMHGPPGKSRDDYSFMAREWEFPYIMGRDVGGEDAGLGEVKANPQMAATVLLRGFPIDRDMEPHRLRAYSSALNVARSARFEHGQSGAT